MLLLPLYFVEWLVIKAVAVPVEVDFDAAVFVGVDFFSWRADDDGGLGPAREGLCFRCSGLWRAF